MRERGQERQVRSTWTCAHMRVHSAVVDSVVVVVVAAAADVVLAMSASRDGVEAIRCCAEVFAFDIGHEQSSKLAMDTLRETSREARGCQGMITLNQIK